MVTLEEYFSVAKRQLSFAKEFAKEMDENPQFYKVVRNYVIWVVLHSENITKLNRSLSKIDDIFAESEKYKNKHRRLRSYNAALKKRLKTFAGLSISLWGRVQAKIDEYNEVAKSLKSPTQKTKNIAYAPYYEAFNNLLNKLGDKIFGYPDTTEALNSILSELNRLRKKKWIAHMKRFIKIYIDLKHFIYQTQPR